MKIKGLKKAVGDYQRVNSDGPYSPCYGEIMLDAETGEIWTMENRYIISGYVDEIQEFNNGIRTAYIIDQNGEEWVYSYGTMEECPAEHSKVTMIMNNNGTADFHDGMIEDVLFCNDCENIED